MSQAAIPQKMSYQGYLTNVAGVPINGTLQMAFSIYNVSSGGSPLWTETHSVTVSQGIYSVILGEGSTPNPINLPFDTTYYLGVQVGADPEMAPRKILTSVGYAFRALTVESIGSHSHSGADITSGTVSEARIDSLIARDSEVMTIVKTNDGSGSGLDADLLDGQHATSFAVASHNHDATYVNEGQANSVTSGMIVDGAITNADVNASAAISDTKLGTISTAGKVADTALSTNVALLNNNQTVTGLKTFNPSSGTDPFSVAPGKTGMVTYLNAEMVGGKKLADLDIRYGQASPVQNPRSNSLITADSGGDVGLSPSITIGTDGLPIISYHSFSAGTLKVVHCGNAFCSLGRTITTLDSGGGGFNSIAIGWEGLPVISYFDSTNEDLKMAHCGTTTCSAGNTVTTVDSVGMVGIDTSITIGTDGLPVISYYDNTNGDLKVAHCGNAACSSGNTITPVDSGGDVGIDTSITIGMDGRPVISYYDSTNGRLKVAHCGNGACSSGNTINNVDSVEVVGLNTSITIGTDGLPVISYYDSTNDDLKVAHCGNATCSSGNTITTVDSGGNVGLTTSITIGMDGLPVISYYDQANGNLKVTHCGNAACSSGNTITWIDSGGDVGISSSITIGTDGLPVISYYDSTNEDLKVAKCTNQFCLSMWSRR